jgi:predicted O-methyltransferase YrrM
MTRASRLSNRNVALRTAATGRIPYSARMTMTPQRWDATRQYIHDLCGRADDHLSTLMEDAVAAGLPNIAINTEVGRLIQMLVRTTRRQLVIEVGTLGGFSGIWIARGLLDTGRLITIEHNDLHADFAQQQFQRAGVADKIEIRRGAGMDHITKLDGELAPGSVDFVFLDALRSDYPRYWPIIKPWIAPGGYICSDNALGGGGNTYPGLREPASTDTDSGWWIDMTDHPNRVEVHAYNQRVTEDPDFDAMLIPLRQGVLVARKRED